MWMTQTAFLTILLCLVHSNRYKKAKITENEDTLQFPDTDNHVGLCSIDRYRFENMGKSKWNVNENSVSSNVVTKDYKEENSRHKRDISKKNHASNLFTNKCTTNGVTGVMDKETSKTMTNSFFVNNSLNSDVMGDSHLHVKNIIKQSMKRKKNTNNEDDENEADVNNHKKRNRRKKRIKKKKKRHWGKWGEWSHCSVTCGKGRKIRSRKCIAKICSSGEIEMGEKTCQLPACSFIDKLLSVF